MEFEKNQCDRCTRVCFCCVLGTSRLCDLCLEAMIHDPDTKKIMSDLMTVYGIPQIEADNLP